MFKYFPKKNRKTGTSLTVFETICFVFLITTAVFLSSIMVFTYSFKFINLITIGFMVNAIFMLIGALANLLIILFCKFPAEIGMHVEFISGMLLLALVLSLNFIEIFRV